MILKQACYLGYASMFRLLKILSTLILSILVTDIVYAQSAGVNQLRYSKSVDYSRMVFDLTMSVEHHVFLLNKPARVVIDLKNTKLLKPRAQPPVS